MVRFESQNLLIDADDTLWENNRYFEQVIAEVQLILQPLGTEPARFRIHLDQIERGHIPQYGYGTLNFSRSLLEAFENFLKPGADLSLRIRVEQLALGIMKHPLEILEGVPETLSYLSGRHSLYLVTKGDPDEQTAKIGASALAGHFRHVEIVREKNPETYRQLAHRHDWELSKTWMIGNSPRSDTNPALAAGLRAVLIPHPHTWSFEHEEPIQDPRLLELKRFAELREHF